MDIIGIFKAFVEPHILKDRDPNDDSGFPFEISDIIDEEDIKNDE